MPVKSLSELPPVPPGRMQFVPLTAVDLSHNKAFYSVRGRVPDLLPSINANESTLCLQGLDATASATFIDIMVRSQWHVAVADLEADILCKWIVLLCRLGWATLASRSTSS